MLLFFSCVDLYPLIDSQKKLVLSFFSISYFFLSFFLEERETTGRGAGITLQAAKYSSEDAAQIVEYIQLVVQFSKKYQPYQKTLQILEGLRIEKEDQAALLRAQKLQVSEELISEVMEICQSYFYMFLKCGSSQKDNNILRGIIVFVRVCQ